MNGWTTTSIAVLFASMLVAAIAGVGLFRRWTLRRNLLDVPNDRSSHSVPTPRGGGLVIALLGLLGYVIVAAFFGAPFSRGYFIGAILISVISWFDDLYSLPFWSRLLVHFAASIILVADVGFWTEIAVPFTSTDVPLGEYFGATVTVLWLVWFINAYNFMDGIDGIAALQAIVAFSAWSLLAYLFHQPHIVIFGGMLACVSAGFIVHNWQPARIFMGDVGSAYLGFTLAAMPLLALRDSSIDPGILPGIAVLVLWPFVFDTVVTVIKRAVRKQRIWEAHREHIYQKMVIEGMPHATVTTIYGALAAAISFSLVLAIAFSGIYAILALSSFVIATSSMIYFGSRNLGVKS